MPVVIISGRAVESTRARPKARDPFAARDADPLLPYATDEDALGTYSPSAIDPLDNQFDASSDPLAYFRKRFEIVNELWTSMPPL